MLVAKQVVMGGSLGGEREAQLFGDGRLVVKLGTPTALTAS
jgi:hypothetical protein